MHLPCKQKLVEKVHSLQVQEALRLRREEEATSSRRGAEEARQAAGEARQAAKEVILKVRRERPAKEARRLYMSQDCMKRWQDEQLRHIQDKATFQALHGSLESVWERCLSQVSLREVDPELTAMWVATGGFNEAA